MLVVILGKLKSQIYLLFHFFSLEHPHCSFLLMIFVLRISLVNKEKLLRRLNTETRSEIDMFCLSLQENKLSQ